MSDSTTARTPAERLDTNFITAVLATSEVATKGRYAALNKSTGKLENMDDADNLMPAGLWVQEKNGINANITGDGTIEWVAQSGTEVGTQNNPEAVTGASAITDALKLVYATDNQTLTLTKPATGLPVGYVKKWFSSTNCAVQLFGLQEILLFSLAGTNKKSICLMHLSSLELEGTSAIDLLTSFPLYGHGRIVAFYGILESDDSGVIAGSQVLNLELGTTNLTGGLLTLAFGDTRGAVVASTAITAANEFNNGDLLSIEMAASGTGFTAAKVSRYSIWIDVEYDAGA